MLYLWLADLIVALHGAFIVFAALGGLTVLRWPRLALAHIPAALWGAMVVIAGWPCPLTGLELWLRQRAGLDGYGGGFIAYYLLPLIYPVGLTRAHQIGLGIALIALNIAIYAWVLRRNDKVRGLSHRLTGRRRKRPPR